MAVTITPIGEATASNPVRTSGANGTKVIHSAPKPEAITAPTPPNTAPGAQSAPVEAVKSPQGQSNTEPKATTEPTKPADGTTSTQAPNETKLAFLARQEKALQKARDAIKAERESVQKERETLASSTISKSDLDLDLLGTLARAGYDVNKLSDKILNAPAEPESVRALRAEVAAMKAEKAEEAKKAKEQTGQSYEQHMSQYKTEAEKLAQENQTDYEAIHKFGKAGAVADRIESYFHEHGKMLDVPAAMKLVEDELIEDALKMVGLEKVKAKLAPVPVETGKPQAGKSPTLTHQNTLTSAGKTESRDAKRARLVAEMEAAAYKAKFGS